MIYFKRVLYGIFFGMACPFIGEVLFNDGRPLPTMNYTLLFLAGLVSGVFVARFISFPWFVGGVVGAVCGFYLSLLWLMYYVPEFGYEAMFTVMLVSAASGLLIGGYGFDRLLKSRRRTLGR